MSIAVHCKIESCPHCEEGLCNQTHVEITIDGCTNYYFEKLLTEGEVYENERDDVYLQQL